MFLHGKILGFHVAMKDIFIRIDTSANSLVTLTTKNFNMHGTPKKGCPFKTAFYYKQY